MGFLILYGTFTGTITLTASDTSSKDLGESHTYRYVNATAVYDAGYALADYNTNYRRYTWTTSTGLIGSPANINSRGHCGYYIYIRYVNGNGNLRIIFKQDSYFVNSYGEVKINSNGTVTSTYQILLSVYLLYSM